MLTPSEKFVAQISQITPFNVQALIRVSAVFNELTLRKALKFIQEKHPHLQVGIRRENGFEFIPCKESIPFRMFDGVRHSEHEISVEDLNSTFDSEYYPLCKVAWIKYPNKNTFIFTLHHAVADGISIDKLTDEFLEFCNGIALNSIGSDEQVRCLDKPLESLLPACKIKNFPTEDEIKITCVENIMLAEKSLANKTLHMTHQFSCDDTIKLIQLTKKKTTSVHALISSVAIIALGKQVSEECTNQFNEISYISPVNLRPLLAADVSDSELGHYVSCYIDKYKLDNPISVWDFARQIKSDISNFISGGSAIAYVYSQKALLEKYPNGESLVQNIKWTTPVVGVTNIGMIKNHNHGRMISAESKHIFNCIPDVWDHPFAYMLGVLTYNNRLQIDLMYVSPAISDEKAKKYLHYFIEIMNNIFE